MTKVERLPLLQTKKPDQKDAEAAVSALNAITNAPEGGGDKVTLVGFGTFEVRERPARKGRNPQTGEEITIEASSCPLSRSRSKALRLCPVICFRAGPPKKPLRRGGFVIKKGTTMRLDKIPESQPCHQKRRTLANEVADAGRVLVNGKAHQGKLYRQGR